MKTQTKINLDPSRLYGYKIVAQHHDMSIQASLLASKVGEKGSQDAMECSPVFNSTIGSKVGFKGPGILMENY